MEQVGFDTKATLGLCYTVFITLSVHLCVQHDERDTVHCTGWSAVAETCVNTVTQDALHVLAGEEASFTCGF